MVRFIQNFSLTPGFIGNGKFLDTTYNPDEVFVRAINDQQSIIGAYSYLLGAYPDSVNGLTIESNIEKLDNVPVKNFDVNQVRGNLHLGNPSQDTVQGRLYPGNPDALFLTQLSTNYPGQSRKIDQQLLDAKNEYQETHGTKFYEDFAKAMHKPVDNVEFFTIFRYADDILTSKANGERSSVNLNKELMDQLSVYYGHYFGNGVFRDSALTRTFAHPYLSSVAHELQLKMQDDQTGKWSNYGIHEAKHSVYLANHLTLLASLHLFNEVEDYHVDFNDELRFQLYKNGGKYYVRTLLNEKPLRLEGTANGNGEAEWSAWRDYICSKLYYGNVDNVRSGRENPAEHVRLGESCENFLSKAFYNNDKVLLQEHERAPARPQAPTPVPVVKKEPKAEFAPSILINNMDAGVKSQNVDINAGRTSQAIQYGWNKPVKMAQTQWADFDIPMRKGFAFDNISKKDVALNQYRRIKIEKTNNTPLSLAERHSFNFEHDLLKTREITFNNVDLVRIPQMSEQNLYLADRHQYNWGENPSLTTKKLRFNHHFKIKIPQNTVTNFAIPERHNFNYDSNSLDVRKVNFDHIKSVRVQQAESYDVNLADFRFESLQKDQAPTANQAAPVDTQFRNNPVQKIDRTKKSSGAKVSLGGNVKTTPDYVAPIRIKQEYNPYGVKSTADQAKPSAGELRTVPEPTQYVPEAPRQSSYPRYQTTAQTPTPQPQAQPTRAPTPQPQVQQTRVPTQQVQQTRAPTQQAQPVRAPIQQQQAYPSRQSSAQAYPRYQQQAPTQSSQRYSNTGSNRVSGSQYQRY
jgi:hypothetical protein